MCKLTRYEDKRHTKCNQFFIKKKKKPWQTEALIYTYIIPFIYYQYSIHIHDVTGRETPVRIKKNPDHWNLNTNVLIKSTC